MDEYYDHDFLDDFDYHGSYGGFSDDYWGQSDDDWLVDDDRMEGLAECLGTPTTLHHPRLPYGTLRVKDDEDDENVTATRVLKDIKNAGDRYHILDLTFRFLGDENLEKIFELLGDESTPNAERDQTAAASNNNNNNHKPLSQGNWLRLVASVSQTMKLDPKPTYGSFRVLDLDQSDITIDCFPALCKLLTDNVTLQMLSLKSNMIEDDPIYFTNLAEALGKSGLRHLCLSSNPIMPRSVAAFFDALPASGTALECLELSTVLTNEYSDSETLEEDTLVAAKAVASFIADSRRCRSLHTLLLNGNGFGVRGVRTIVFALVGSKATSRNAAGDTANSQVSHLQRDPFYENITRTKLQDPNRCLEVLELSGNVPQGWKQQDPQEDIEKFDSIRKRYAPVSSGDIEAIVSYLDHRARQGRKLGKDTADTEVPLEVSRHLPTLGVTFDEWESDFQEAAEFGAGITSSNWQSLKKARLDANKADGERCRRAAVQILRAARTVGCRAGRRKRSSDQEPPRQAIFRFLDLPPELRLLILRNLNEHNSLSALQFSRVISFACEPSTIGYGAVDYDWSRVLNSSAAPASNLGSSASLTLPADRWSWSECFALRAPPRDWDADLLDASDESDMLRSRSFGQFWQYSTTKPSMYAFLESTLTQRAES